MDRNTGRHPGLIQIAGIHSLEEARMLLDEGVDLVGIPLRLAVNTEDLSEQTAARISRAIPGRCCLITYLSQPDEIAELARELAVSWVQLHGQVDPAVFTQLRRELPRVTIIKSLVIGRQSIQALEREIRTLSDTVTAFITDTFDPATGAEGATGQTHDWEISRRLCSLSSRPVILAGGLTPGNVADAIAAVRPSGVDAHTGVEDSTGIKSRRKVRSFVKSARLAMLNYARPQNDIVWPNAPGPLV